MDGKPLPNSGTKDMYLHLYGTVKGSEINVSFDNY